MSVVLNDAVLVLVDEDQSTSQLGRGRGVGCCGRDGMAAEEGTPPEQKPPRYKRATAPYMIHEDEDEEDEDDEDEDKDDDEDEAAPLGRPL